VPQKIVDEETTAVRIATSRVTSGFLHGSILQVYTDELPGQADEAFTQTDRAVLVTQLCWSSWTLIVELNAALDQLPLRLASYTY
jgi:hypothetical protein